MWSNLLVALTLAGSAWAQFSISTPASLVQCQPASIKWTGGESPFILAVIPGGEVSAATISTLSTSLTTSPYTWNVNLPTGTYITLRLTDAKGNITYSSPLTIQAGADSSCLDTTASTSGLATGAVTTTGSGSSTLTATTSASGAGTSVTAAAAVSSARSSAAAASSHSSVSGAASSASAASSLRASSSSTPVRSASSAAASTTGGAMPTAAFGYPAVVAGLLGAVAVLA